MQQQLIYPKSANFVSNLLHKLLITDAYTIYAGRAITGFCIGIVSLSLPVYLAEAIHPEVRGVLGQWFFNFLVKLPTKLLLFYKYPWGK